VKAGSVQTDPAFRHWRQRVEPGLRGRGVAPGPAPHQIPPVSRFAGPAVPVAPFF